MEKLKDIINFFYKYFPFKLDVNKVSNVNGRYINKKKTLTFKGSMCFNSIQGFNKKL